MSLFFQTKTVLAGSLKESGSICDPLETLNQKFQTKIWGKSGTFWKRNSNVFIGRRVKI